MRVGTGGGAEDGGTARAVAPRLDLDLEIWRPSLSGLELVWASMRPTAYSTNPSSFMVDGIPMGRLTSLRMGTTVHHFFQLMYIEDTEIGLATEV